MFRVTGRAHSDFLDLDLDLGFGLSELLGQLLPALLGTQKTPQKKPSIGLSSGRTCPCWAPRKHLKISLTFHCISCRPAAAGPAGHSENTSKALLACGARGCCGRVPWLWRQRRLAGRSCARAEGRTALHNGGIPHAARDLAVLPNCGNYGYTLGSASGGVAVQRRQPLSVAVRGMHPPTAVCSRPSLIEKLTKMGGRVRT
jgi:hypothetical protein